MGFMINSSGFNVGIGGRLKKGCFGPRGVNLMVFEGFWMGSEGVFDGRGVYAGCLGFLLYGG